MKGFKNQDLRKKLLLSLIVLVIAATAYTSVANIPFGAVDDKGRDQLSAVGKRAMLTFAVARGLNGVISVIQGTDVTISFGVGTKLAVGEILDPINDVVEQFSNIMLLACISLGMQQVLLTIGPWLGFQVILLVSMVFLLAGIWWPDWQINFRYIGYRMLFLAVVIRFIVPMTAFASDFVFKKFLAARYEQSFASLERIDQKMGEVDRLSEKGEKKGNAKENSFLDRLVDVLKSGQDLSDVSNKIKAVRSIMSDYAAHAIDLIVVFLLQTVLLPLAVLFFVYRCAGYFLKIGIQARK